MEPDYPGPAAPFFGAVGRPALLRTFGLGQNRGRAHDKNSRNR